MPRSARSGSGTHVSTESCTCRFGFGSFSWPPGPSLSACLHTVLPVANGTWLAAVLVGTAIAGWYGQLPGVEPRPYILRFDEDKPNPALSQNLLHLRVERSYQLCAAQCWPVWPSPPLPASGA